MVLKWVFMSSIRILYIAVIVYYYFIFGYINYVWSPLGVLASYSCNLYNGCRTCCSWIYLNGNCGGQCLPIAHLSACLYCSMAKQYTNTSTEIMVLFPFHTSRWLLHFLLIVVQDVCVVVFISCIAKSALNWEVMLWSKGNFFLN